MKCTNCNTPIDDGQTFCPECGSKVESFAPLAEILPPDEPTPQTEIVPEVEMELPEELPPVQPEAETEPQGHLPPPAGLANGENSTPPSTKSGMKPGGVIALALAAAVIIALAIFVFGDILGGIGELSDQPDAPADGATDDTAGDSDTPDVSDLVPSTSLDLPDYDNADTTSDTLVATFEDYSMSNSKLLYYYWNEYMFVQQTYGDYISMLLDPMTALSQQVMQGTEVSWATYFIDLAVETWGQSVILSQMATDDGFIPPAEVTAELDGMEDSLELSAVEYGFDDANALLQATFGPVATVDGYIEFMTEYMISSAYANSIYDEFYQSNIHLEAEQKFGVNVRHILISPTDDTEQAMEDAEQLANDLYFEWSEGEATEDSFAALATEHTQDPGSAGTGGLYENVTPGQMVEEFDFWCFEEGRAIGDSGIVQTDYGYHIMYMSGWSDIAYENLAQTTTQEQYYAWMDDLFEDGSADIDYDSINLYEREMVPQS